MCLNWQELPESRRKLTRKNKVEMKLQSAYMKGLLDLQDTLAADAEEVRSVVCTRATDVWRRQL